MKKLLIFLLFSAGILSATAQNWHTVNLDSVVSIKLPYAHTLTDTLGQRLLISKLSNGDIQVLVTPDNPMRMPDIEKKRHLLKYYDSYLAKIRSSAKDGKIINEKDGKLGNLLVKDFTLEVDSGRGVQHRDFRILHENGATYTFQVLYQGIHEELTEDERNTFYSSIKVENSPEVQSQFTEGSGNGSSNNSIIYISAGVLVLLILIFFIIRSRRKRRPGD